MRWYGSFGAAGNGKERGGTEEALEKPHNQAATSGNASDASQTTAAK